MGYHIIATPHKKKAFAFFFSFHSTEMGFTRFPSGIFIIVTLVGSSVDMESFWMEGYAGQFPNSGHELAIYVL